MSKETVPNSGIIETETHVLLVLNEEVIILERITL